MVVIREDLHSYMMVVVRRDRSGYMMVVVGRDLNDTGWSSLKVTIIAT